MLEMLGVLAIVGVLSIGGLAGFRGALDKNQENKVFDEASLQGLEILTNRKLKMNGEEIRYPYSSDFIVSRTFDAYRKNVILKTNTLAKTVCQGVATKSNQGIFGDITCAENNVLTFMVPISAPPSETNSGGSDNTGGGTGGSTGGDSGTGSDDNTTITDPCKNKECGKCEKCENGICVENPAMNDLSCGTNKYCRYGECLECGSVQETCASDAWGSNGCQTHKHKDCESNQYCDAAGICRDCPTQSCDTSCCALTGPKDVCNNPTPEYGSDAIYYANNENGCLVEKTGCSLTNPPDETQSCTGTCDENGNCIKECTNFTATECITACEKVNGVENKTFASNTTSCGTAGLCDGQGACVECSAIDNCATLTSENGKCECATCATGYMVSGGKCIEKATCSTSEQLCSNSESTWCCPNTQIEPGDFIECGTQTNECTYGSTSCILPNQIMWDATYIACCEPGTEAYYDRSTPAPVMICCDENDILTNDDGCCSVEQGYVAYYNAACVSECTNVDNCSTYDTNCACTECEDGYTLTNGRCVEEITCSELTCSNDAGESWCCTQPFDFAMESGPSITGWQCGESVGECCWDVYCCQSPNEFILFEYEPFCCSQNSEIALVSGHDGTYDCCDLDENIILGKHCCPKNSVAVYNFNCVSECTNVDNCSTYDTSCNCTDCEGGYKLDTSTGLCDLDADGGSGSSIEAQCAEASGTIVTATSGTFCMRDESMTWNDANTWCQKYGMTMPEMEEMCPTWNGDWIDGKCSELEGKGNGYAWSATINSNDSQIAFIVNLSDSSVYYDYRNDYGYAYAICR